MRVDTIAVVGSGLMGRGIAHAAAVGGYRTVLHDLSPAALEQARRQIRADLDEGRTRGKLSAADADTAYERLRPEPDLDRAVAEAGFVIEAVPERMELKLQVFARLDEACAETIVLASNTSSLSVTEMAAACKRPERVAGYHFFNPVPVMKIVEVVDGVLTEPWVTEALTALARRFGHTPVRCKDTPGFVVNHAGRAFVPEALRVLSEGIADVASIDRILVDAAGFRIGPFGLMDLVGLDVAHAVMKSMYEQYFEEPKYRPSFIAEPRVAAGLHGRKTKRGWYEYNPELQMPPEPPAPTRKPATVWAVPELRELLNAPSADKPRAEVCFVAPLGSDCTAAALEHGLDPARTVAVDPLFGFSKRRTLMVNPVTRPEVREQAHALLAAGGVPVSVIKDSPGFVAQRVVAHIVNVGCDIVQMRIATPEDLDRAVMLGLGYPKGPLAMGDALGAKRILTVLQNMHELYQEPRYRPSPWLRRRAHLGVSLLTSEN